MKTRISLVMLACLCLTHTAVAERDRGSRVLSVALSRNTELDAMHAEISAEGWANKWVSGNLDASVLVRSGIGIRGGFGAGVRVNTPGYVSPFVGVGVFVGRWRNPDADDSGNPDEDDAWGVEFGTEKKYDYLAAVYPEAGLRLWIGGGLFLSGHVRYYVTTAGRSKDCLTYGGGLGIAF